MQHTDLIDLLEHVGKDPSRLIFEDELTGIHNRRFFLSYLEHRIRWERDDDFPLSLLMIDLDHFKEINDTHGHETGDQALLWMATLLREVGGEHALPIRYGGDEFILLLPKAGTDASREMADRLLQRTKDRPFRLRDADVSVPISLSIGFATAPQDASSSKELFQAADTALFHAKHAGKNQAAAFSEVDPATVFPKTALYRLKATGIAGRDEEMAVVSDTLESLTRGQSEFLLVEAAPGMGKTTFLEAVRRNLVGDDTFCVARASGDSQEGYRPYYLSTGILLALFNQREDRGAALVEELTGEEIDNLGYILPQLGAGEGRPIPDDTGRRRAIFSTLARVLPRAADYRPLVLLIDDLQFADEATLLLLGVLMQSPDISVLICGTSVETLRLSGEEEAPPLERFCAARREDLAIRRVKLKPLTVGGISEYLKAVFPRLRTPDSFEDDLADITQGNPLFLGEIIRKLVHDGKVSLVGQEWVIEPLEDGYLPRSLEEIVKQKIAALDEQERSLLEHASTLGEGVSLSLLAGASELDENRVLEFLDRAETLGLVSLDFQVNDEVMRFLGKRVLDITYGNIDSSRRQELHRQIGDYQENLYQQRLLPSASLLAYHFRRSANQEKARRYEQIQTRFSDNVFDPNEAAVYTEELVEVETEAERRLTPDSVPRVPYVLRTFMSAVRNIQLYPPESRTIADALRDVHDAVDIILEKNDELHLSHAQRALLANGQRLEVSRYSMLAKSFIGLLTRAELQGIIFRRGVTREEIRALLMALGKLKFGAIEQGYWRSFAEQHALEHIELRQVRYSRLRRKKARATIRQPVIEEEELGPEELAEIPRILRHLQGTAQNARLYPLESNQVSRSVDQLYDALMNVLGHQPALTLARADRLLLVNGSRIDTTGFAPLAVAVVDLMESVGLSSLTFSAGLPKGELLSVVGALHDPPDTGYEADFWDSLVREKGLDYIAFNQRQYAAGVVQTMLSAIEVEVEEEPVEDDAAARLAAQMVEEPEDALRDALPRFGKELLVKGEHGLLERLLKQLFGDFQRDDPADRELTVLACRALLDGLILGLQHKFTELAAQPLLRALAEENEPRVLQELAAVLYAMSGSCLYFADYQTASRILMELKERQEGLERSSDGRGGLARLLDRRLDPTALELLKDDLSSGRADRQERAAQVFGSLGRSSIPLLIQVIKDEKDFRVRQVAASLLAEHGQEAARGIKRAVATEVTVEQRFRILEVIDTVTRDLRDELIYSFGDSSAKIRRAAFRLFERLHQDDLIDTILPLARDQDASVAKGAIRSIAHLRSATAVEELGKILDETEEPKVAIACCQALGEIGSPAGIDVLGRVLGKRSPPFFRRRWDDQVRATAAMALRQIEDPEAERVLSRYAKDRAVRVRQLARPAPSEPSA
ncbi:MAG: diguanylate cyclase [Gemmatimonadetes bacterium]|uniref:diguanylate cyclase n=1 Tax=Candidatus Kutchimonas denitrificans TaxID=3056748 RepID=A0AAE5CCK2_9BACT|nr:diguanylate cyclase [Gemmatimonadota bacterium]NIR76068.1 diguanylate cyclase [Candidatus Kutchimonas denitrificans]NIS00447.1 diguanylate cyclase [Gemmatimonadota bacterium]NIT66105.1 diguanylate cyclase [Gemmatimonadota bacterium]NIU54183.1 diguanylate cyclase [Gemmatimonadota bacterium]